MGDTRYQVFVSSTFSDLKEERARVSQALMEMNCIPAGMELFPATDEEQFSFIRTVIDESDYYVLIIGGRYGSVTSEGISYTEKEYDYAISRGMEICAFIHSAPETIPSGKTDLNQDLRAALDRFKTRVSSGRLVKYWDDPKDLPGKVVISLNSAIRRKPAIGWIRGNREAPPEALNEIMTLREENAKLKQSLRSNGPGEQHQIIADLNKVISLQYDKKMPFSRDAVTGLMGLGAGSTTHDFSMSLAEIVKKIGYDFIDPAPMGDLIKLIPGFDRKIFGLGLTTPQAQQVTLTKNSLEKVKIALVATGILVESGSGGFALGAMGKRALFEIATQED
jgi:hypothetical protein